MKWQQNSVSALLFYGRAQLCGIGAPRPAAEITSATIKGTFQYVCDMQHARYMQDIWKRGLAPCHKQCIIQRSTASFRTDSFGLQIRIPHITILIGTYRHARLVGKQAVPIGGPALNLRSDALAPTLVTSPAALQSMQRITTVLLSTDRQCLLS